MRHKTAWSLLALLLAACAIPDVDIVDSLDSGETDNGDSGSSNQAGTKNVGKGGNTTTDGGIDDGGDTGEGAGPSTGGTGTGGKPTAPGGTGGSRPSGGTGPGGTGGTGPQPLPAVAKFCNGVSYQGAAIELEVRIGSGSNLVRISALTGTCMPLNKCLPIPTGTQPVEVYETNGTPFWTGATAQIEPNEAWIFAVYFDDTTQMPDFDGTPDFTTPAQCGAVTYNDAFPSTPTAPSR